MAGWTGAGSRVTCGGWIWRRCMRWEPMPSLLAPRRDHGCCVVRDTVVVLGGLAPGGSLSLASVEMFSREEGAFTQLPPLSCGGMSDLSLIAVDETDSAAGQVLMLGGGETGREVHLVDLATGTCTRQPDMLRPRSRSAAARLKDGRVVCAGGVVRVQLLRRRCMARPPRERSMRRGRGRSCPRRAVLFGAAADV